MNSLPSNVEDTKSVENETIIEELTTDLIKNIGPDNSYLITPRDSSYQ